MATSGSSRRLEQVEKILHSILCLTRFSLGLSISVMTQARAQITRAIALALTSTLARKSSHCTRCNAHLCPRMRFACRLHWANRNEKSRCLSERKDKRFGWRQSCKYPAVCLRGLVRNLPTVCATVSAKILQNFCGLRKASKRASSLAEASFGSKEIGPRKGQLDRQNIRRFLFIDLAPCNNADRCEQQAQ